MGTCGSSLRIVSIFSVKELSRSRAESEDGGGGVGSLRRLEKIWNHGPRLIDELGTGSLIAGQNK